MLPICVLFHIAVCNGHSEALQIILLEDPGGIQRKTQLQETPLFFAVKNWSMECVEILLSWGADIEILNLRGQRPVDLTTSQDMRFMLLIPTRVTLSKKASLSRHKCIACDSFLSTCNELLTLTDEDSTTERGATCFYAHGLEEHHKAKKTAVQNHSSGAKKLKRMGIFVGGLPPSVNSDSVGELFEYQFGPVVDSVVILAQTENKKQSPCFGFVAFREEKSVSAAVQAHYVTMAGKPVEIKILIPRLAVESEKMSPREQEPEKTSQSPLPAQMLSNELEMEGNQPEQASWASKLLYGQPKTFPIKPQAHISTHMVIQPNPRPRHQLCHTFRTLFSSPLSASRWKGACMQGSDFRKSNRNRKWIGARHYNVSLTTDSNLSNLAGISGSPRDSDNGGNSKCLQDISSDDGGDSKYQDISINDGGDSRCQDLPMDGGNDSKCLEDISVDGSANSKCLQEPSRSSFVFPEETGTVNCAIILRNRILVAVDSRATDPNNGLIVKEDADKIFHVNRRIIATMAGDSGLCMEMLEFVKDKCRGDIFIASKAAKHFVDNWKLRNPGREFKASTIIAGYRRDKTPVLYVVSGNVDDNTCEERKLVIIAIGAGKKAALDYCGELVSEDNMEAAMESDVDDVNELENDILKVLKGAIVSATVDTPSCVGIVRLWEVKPHISEELYKRSFFSVLLECYDDFAIELSSKIFSLWYDCCLPYLPEQQKWVNDQFINFPFKSHTIAKQRTCTVRMTDYDSETVANEEYEKFRLFHASFKDTIDQSQYEHLQLDIPSEIRELPWFTIKHRHSITGNEMSCHVTFLKATLENIEFLRGV